MEQQSEQNSAHTNVRVGDSLKAARERAGLSLGEVADRLKLSVRQLEAIEANEFDQLPGATFVRGFVRSYARFVQIDDQPLMQALEQHFPSAVNDIANLVQPRGEAQVTAAVAEVVMAPRGATSSSSGSWIKSGLLLLALLGAGAWYVASDSNHSASSLNNDVQSLPAGQQAASVAIAESSAPAAVEAPQVVASAATAAVEQVPVQAAAPEAAKPATATASAPVATDGAAATGKIVLNAKEAAWISVIDGKGNKLQFGTLPAGGSKELSGTPPFQLKIGNATQVQLSFNGQAVDLAQNIRGNTAKIELK